MVRRAIFLLVLAILPLGTSPTAARQAEEPRQIGVGGASGAAAFAVVGQTRRRNDRLSFYGYLSRVAGLTAEEVFTDPDDPGAGTARFTVFGSADLDSRIELDGMVVESFSGTTRIYTNQGGGADYAVPESFFAGTAVAEADASLQDVRAAEEDGAALIAVDLAITTAEPFPFGDESLRFGQPGASFLVTALGATRDAAGSAVVTDFAGTAVAATGAPGEGAPATRARVDGCVGVRFLAPGHG